MLDLSLVREWVQELYAERGRPSIDPVVFLKLQLIMFFERIRSERQLIATASLNLAHRWYLGYALDEPLPDSLQPHAELATTRHRRLPAFL
jgi:transposase